MREMPIIMSCESVRAILAGRKTQTRRVIPPRKPRYRVDDLLWVRESWRIIGWEPEDVAITVQFKADNSWIDGVAIEDEWAFDRYAKQCRDDAKKAGIGIGGDGRYEWEGEPPTRWRSPVTMPKVAARLWLRVTNMRMERLRNITETDAIAEGCLLPEEGAELMKTFFRYPFREVYRDWWNELMAKRGYPWEDNPWIWVYRFEVERMEK